MKNKYELTLTSAADGDGTFVVTGETKGGGGHWGMHTSAYEATKIMLRLAGGIGQIETRENAYVDPSPNGEDPKAKAIRTLYIPHKPTDITLTIGPIDGNVSWRLNEDEDNGWGDDVVHVEEETR